MAQVVLPCGDLEATVAWFENELGFRMTMITPADDPSVAVLETNGLTIRLDCESNDAPGALLILTDRLREPITAPNGTTVSFDLANPQLDLPPNQPEFVISRYADAQFGSGRAGMGYRDLVPNRHGGRIIASHIMIPEGGPVPDYVHHHHIRFQMIFCHAGWADLVYEDQGEPFRMQAGDCVLQPPHIRHRVLETSNEFEVVEISSPAVHDTLRDHALGLPTTTHAPDRDFGGQRFVWHRSDETATTQWRTRRFTMEDFGIGIATGGLAHVGIVRSIAAGENMGLAVTDEFVLWFVRTGTLRVDAGDESHTLGPRDCAVLATGEFYNLNAETADTSFLEVRIT